MDEGSRLSSLVVVVLLLLAMYFAIAETAFASVSVTKLRTRAEKGNAHAKKAVFITEHFDNAVTTLLILTNIVHLMAASIVTVTVVRNFGTSFVTLSTVITTLVVFFFGEMLPKSIARKYPERFALSMAGPLLVLMRVLKPLAFVLTGIGNAAASLTRGDDGGTVTEEELYDIIEDMTEEGSLKEEEGDLISSAISFGDTTVESILTSRIDTAAIDISLSQEALLAFIKEQKHSRLPVYEDTIDHIVGTLQIRKYIKEYLKEGSQVSVRGLMDAPYFVHQSTKIDDLLTVMSKNQINMAVVTDNYGGTLGVVTVEDILEELVGEIWDEDDRVIRNIMLLSDGTYSVNPEEQVIDLLDELGIGYDEEEEEKIKNKLLSELTFEHFTAIPKEGESFVYQGLRIAVSRMKFNRILRLHVSILPKENAEEKGGAV